MPPDPHCGSTLMFRLDKERNPSKEAVEERLRKRKRRVLTARGPDVGKEAQDMRMPNETNYRTKKVISPR